MRTNYLPLVLIHGYPLDHSMWFGVIAALGGGLRTVSPDLRGFGKAGPPHDDPAIEGYAEDILRALKRDKIEKAVVAGMSMGGYVALALAEMAPKTLGGLALVNSQCFADTEEARNGRREMIKKVRAEGIGAAVRAVIPRMFAPARAENPDYQKFVVEGAEAAGVEGICWALEAMARRPDRSHVVADAEFPILALHSLDDRLVPIEKARQMAALNPKVFTVALQNCGHGAAMELPDEVATPMRKFVEICSEPQAAEQKA